MVVCDGVVRSMSVCIYSMYHNHSILVFVSWYFVCHRLRVRVQRGWWMMCMGPSLRRCEILPAHAVELR